RLSCVCFLSVELGPDAKLSHGRLHHQVHPFLYVPERYQKGAHSSALLASVCWRRRPILGRFLDFARKVSGCRFRRQQHHVGDGSSPVRICCKHHCCRLFESVALHHAPRLSEAAIRLYRDIPEFPAFPGQVQGWLLCGDAELWREEAHCRECL